MYQGDHSGPNEAGREASDDGVALEELLEQEWLWGQAADIEDVFEERLELAWRLVQAAGCAALVTKKGYVLVIRDIASDLQDMRRGPEATTKTLGEWEAQLSELDL